jgi:predicted nucleic acid-binding protein
MILLDTNYLIRALVPGSAEAAAVFGWIDAQEDLCASSVCWYEFLCGPVDEEGAIVVRAILRDRILPFTGDQAAESSRLFNAVGRKRTLRVDAMIAAAAIVSNADLATANLDDFSAFEPFGLRLTR